MADPTTDEVKHVENQRRAFESGLRAVTALFAAVLGFGLRELLGQNGLREEFPLSPQWGHLAIFIIAVTLFARFIIGSAIHATFEHVRKPVLSPYLLLTDISFISMYGILGLAMCYAASLSMMLYLAAAICLIAAVWWVVDFVIRSILSARRGSKQKPIARWHHFLILDLICGPFYAWGGCMLTKPAKCMDAVYFGIGGCEAILWMFALGSCIVLIVDLFLQLRAVSIAPAPSNAA